MPSSKDSGFEISTSRSGSSFSVRSVRADDGCALVAESDRDIDARAACTKLGASCRFRGLGMSLGEYKYT